jgi:large subunit ribosomal protein L1
MAHRYGKRLRALAADFDSDRLYDAVEAAGLVKKNANAKFNETVEIHIRLGVDPKKSDQNVRGVVNLPHGTGRTVRVIVFARGDNARAAEAAGADVVGEADLIERVKGGFSDFDVAVATPDMMAQIGKELGRILAQKMPNPKSGTVTPNPAAAVKDIKAGKVEYRLDKTGIVHAIVGKASFEQDHLAENVATLLDAIVRAKPAAAKGIYLRSISLSSTMGPGVKVDPSRIKATAATA